MKALILVGGFGTRLRPLTFSKSKPLVEFVNKPILCHQIEALSQVGVKEIILAVNFSQNSMFEFIKTAEQLYQVKITVSIEKEPLGTAGPLALARDILEQTEGDDFFVFNSDITCKFPLKDMLNFHKSHKKEGTIMVTKVEDPTKYGVIVSDTDNKILRFVEKPREFISNRINAGLYILNKNILKRIKPIPTSIERDVFPFMAEEGQLYSMDLDGFWMDIGQPADYLKGTNVFLEDISQNDSSKLAKGKNVKGNVLIVYILINKHPTAQISEDSIIGPNVVIGPNVTVKSGSRILNSVLMSDSIIESSSYIEGSIIGWKSQVGSWVRIEGLSILGEDVTVADNLYINSSIILPNCRVKTSLKNPGTILMF